MPERIHGNKRLIDVKPIVQFIMDGLNNPDKMKALGHDAIEILAEIEFAPTVDAVEVVHGKWVQTTENLGWADIICGECSNCHETFVVDEEDSFEDFAMWKYCPNCGAKMDGGNEDV